MSELDAVYVIAGSDRPKVDLAAQRLRARFDPGAVDRFDAATDDAASVIAACNAGTLFGDERLVVVTQADARTGDDGRPRVTWKAPDLAVLAAYAKEPAPGTVLCLVSASSLKKDAPLLKALGKSATLLTYDVVTRSVTPWIVERFRARGVKAEPEAVALLQHLTGSDLHALAQEVDKLVTWSGGEDVTESVVERLVTSLDETPPFALTDAFGARDRATALETMEATLARSHRTTRDEVARLAAALTGHLGRLRAMKAEAATGERPKEIATRLKLHPFYAEKLLRQSEAFSEAELDDVSVALAGLDHALKGGSRLSPELELQRALAAVSHGAGRHG